MHVKLKLVNVLPIALSTRYMAPAAFCRPSSVRFTIRSWYTVDASNSVGTERVSCMALNAKYKKSGSSPCFSVWLPKMSRASFLNSVVEHVPFASYAGP